MKIKNKKQPKISIIMPVYNAGDFLMEAIQSILNQTYQNFEFIIINDNSTDKSWQIIKKYQKKYPQKIKAINLKKTLNRGGDACANYGLKIAKGKYVARMDADDIAHTKRLEKQVNFLEKNPHIFLVGSNAKVIDKKGKVIGNKSVPLTNEEIYHSFFTFNPLIHPSVMFRRLILKKKFFYPKKFSANNDYYIFFKMICQGYKFANLKDKLLFYRIHDKNDTFNNIKEKFFNTLKTRLIMVFKHDYKPSPKQLLVTFSQLFLTLILPESFTKKVYLLTKGIIKIKNPLKKLLLTKNLNLPFFPTLPKIKSKKIILKINSN
ncbi:MAG: glycosyltransferase [Patescibacteria group bacterium]|nr:glycosyltransferase [Patescibacteria group bacterium]